MRAFVNGKKNMAAKLCSLMLCAAGFVLILSEIRSENLRIFDPGGPAMMIFLLITCVCGAAGYLIEDRKNWLRDNWYVCIYILLRIITAEINGAAVQPVFWTSLCWEAFLLLAVNKLSADRIIVKLVLSMIAAFDLIAVSICMHHYLMSGHLLWRLAYGELPDIKSQNVFSLVFFNPNSAGLMAGLTAATFLILAIRSRGYIRALAFIVTAVNIPVLYWTECRTAMVSLAVMAAALAAARFAGRISPKTVICAVLAVCIGAAVPAFVMGTAAASGASAEDAAVEQRVDDILSTRYDIWKQHFASMKGHYLSGFGTLRSAIDARVETAKNASGIETAADEELAHGATNSSLGPHNGYIELFVVAGLPGFLLILLYLYKRLIALNNRYIEANPVLFLLVYLFCTCVMESRFITSGGSYPVLLMFLLLNMKEPLSDVPAVTDSESCELAQGVEESEGFVTLGAAGNVRIHALRISSESCAKIKASYRSFSSLSGHAEAIEAGSEAEVIAAASGDFFDLKTGRPKGMLIRDGRTVNTGDAEPFFAVLKDGRCVIRPSGSESDDAEEAIGGGRILVRKGKVRVKHRGSRHPAQAIGICPDGSVMIVNAEGRQPDSRGLSRHEMAVLMKSLGCTEALNLDGGGSAGLMTKRKGDSEPVLRNIPGDGFERNISTALVIVREGGEDKEPSAEADRSDCFGMADELTGCGSFFDKTISGRYRCFTDGEGCDGFSAVNGESYLFNKGKGVTASFRIGETEYSFKKGRYSGSSDPDAGRVLFGYCGLARYGYRNLIFALHTEDGLLNIGLNDLKWGSCKKECDADESGQMEDWGAKQEESLPWYAYRHRIRSVYIADGVTSIGSRFLYMPKGMVKGGTETPENELSSLRLPASLTRIGEKAFFNKPMLKEAAVPSESVVIEKDAFDEAVKIVDIK